MKMSMAMSNLADDNKTNRARLFLSLAVNFFDRSYLLLIPETRIILG